MWLLARVGLLGAIGWAAGGSTSLGLAGLAWVGLELVAKTYIKRAQYPLIKEYGLDYIGLHIMI